MKPEKNSRTLLAITRSKSKMYEYGVPKQHHIKIPTDPAKLFVLTIGLLGDLAAKVCDSETKPKDLLEDQATLRFAAYFFDAYDASRLDERTKSYLTVVGAAAYYLCDLQGSSSVFAKRLGAAVPDLDAPELASLLVWLVKGDFLEPIPRQNKLFGPSIEKVSNAMVRYFASGDGEGDLFASLDELRLIAYHSGTPRQLLFADIIYALAKKRYWNATWYCLPRYSGLSKADWEPALKRDTFVRELWPAQHLLGEVGIFKGKSAVIQMPTSAGKTRATEIILRSAFLSGRTTLAVVVAPFRALCHEIRHSLLGAFEHDAINVDELTDVLQTDFVIQEIFGRRQVLVVTPEKLVYVLRHSPELAARIGLVIYDEGHQFDSGTRGVTYELLLTTLKRMLPAKAQTLLISAVISNADALNSWLNVPGSQIVSGQGLTPTYRTIGFSSWKDVLGRLTFVEPSDPEKQEFFVPRVIEQVKLKNFRRETKERRFPLKEEGSSVALYFGLKLVANGGVAVFCGTKLAATGICRQAVEIFARGYEAETPVTHSDREEVEKLRYLHEQNIGKDAPATSCAGMGIFAHHASTPHGLRIAIEHSMQQGLVRFVVCTSTLAQGVNLPLRYLIITSTQQGGEKLKVRDFHNLIGRAGRSGMHTEGSILFADPEIYDAKADKENGWRWGQVKELLEPTNSEPCVSSLLSIFEPLSSDNQKLQIVMKPLEFVEDYVQNPDSVGKTADRILQELPNQGFSKENLEKQISDKMAIVRAVESFLMAQEIPEAVTLEKVAAELATGTLAHHLASADEKKSIVELFVLLAKHISSKVPDLKKRAIFGKTLYGVLDSLAVEKWVMKKADSVADAASQEALFDVMWPLLVAHVRNKTFRNCQSPAHLKKVVTGWFQGKSFGELHSILADDDIRIGRYHPTVEHVVEICENAVSYEGMLLVNAVREIYSLANATDTATVEVLDLFQKRLKYGVSSLAEAVIYELGFSDRVICSDLAAIAGDIRSKAGALSRLRRQEVLAREAIVKYPAYFGARFEAMI